MNPKVTRRTFLVGGTALTAIMLGKFPRASAQGTTVNLYSSRHYKTNEALYTSFPGGSVNLVEGKAGELIEQIETEGQNSPADVLLTTDVGNLWKADRAGIFQPVNSQILNREIPANLRHPNGHWFGFSKRARVIFYNKDRVNPSELSTYEDLADPKWRGRILIRPSSNIYNRSLIASLIAAHGEAGIEAWLNGFTANFAREPESNDTGQIRACAEGIGDIAIANSYYYVRLLKSDDLADREVTRKVGMFFPNQGAGERGTHVNVSGGGLLKHSPNKEAAIAFLEYLTSPQAQSYFAMGNNEYPAVPGVSIDPVLDGLGTFSGDPVNVSQYGENLETAISLMEEAGWVS
ncbi:Fe(3+) ABC transporter substrate-binding protein [Oscillatoriales cyanobacterium LEGE 11467]|uniref:Fe(3+) ABC transporter substrate-binding protein n=1 Tax=Zarconia navalis LEGE 11467 TaxID=1828826 RepID=A0A928Z9G3_9CYAN|nr:Fe(3+) ABC transporter substrate-binding protein [Zarconia navalis]MBE9040736.1 Fe(3+) ABC transporter substrate-binding protein [Zarconia navalis LEGE 11467]